VHHGLTMADNKANDGGTAVAHALYQIEIQDLRSIVVHRKEKKSRIPQYTMQTCLVAIPAVLLALVNGSSSNNNIHNNKVKSAFMLVISVVLILLWPRNSTTRKSKLDISPLGVTIHTMQQPNKSIFVPIDHIMDCIVVENVHGYRVSNAVLLRTHARKPCNTQSTKNIELVQCFPGTSLHYKQCITIRQAINTAIHAYK
jgi:hypothetical protein